MAERSLVVDFFGEDAGHFLFVEALLARAARERALRKVQIDSDAGGGIERVRRALRARRKDTLGARGDLLVVLVDANGRGWHKRRGEFQNLVEEAGYPVHVLGCPERCIESWCMLDTEAWRGAFGRVPTITANARPKQQLADAAKAVGQLAPVRMTIVRALAPHFDFVRMAEDPSFRDFLEQFNRGLDWLQDS